MICGTRNACQSGARQTAPRHVGLSQVPAATRWAIRPIGPARRHRSRLGAAVRAASALAGQIEKGGRRLRRDPPRANTRKLACPPPEATQPGGDADHPTRRHSLHVLVEHALGELGRGRLPGSAAARQFVVRQVHVERVGLGVDGDDVAVAHQRQPAAQIRFGRDMAHHKAVRPAGETSVGDERHALAQPLAHDNRGDGEHLAHTGAALRPFIANDHHIAVGDTVLLDGFQRQFFRVKDLSRAGEAQAFFARDLGDRALGGKVAVKNLQMPRRLDRLADGMHDLLACLEVGQVGQVFFQRLARHGHAVAIEQPLTQQQPLHSGHATHVAQFFHDIAARRLEVGQHRRAVGHFLEVVNGQRHIGGARHGDQVHHGVGGAAQCDDHRDGVLKRLARQDVRRLDVLLQQIEQRRADAVAFGDLLRAGRRDGRTVGQAQAQRLDGGPHGVGRVHAAARARAGASMLEHGLELLLGNLFGEPLAVGLKGRDNIQILAVQMAGADGAAVDDDAGPIEPRNRHDRTGHVLVAAGEGDVGIVPLGTHDRLDGVGDDVA